MKITEATDITGQPSDKLTETIPEGGDAPGCFFIRLTISSPSTTLPKHESACECIYMYTWMYGYIHVNIYTCIYIYM
jgi:hypothetical protein